MRPRRNTRSTVKTKLVALITMEIHNRDVMERMIKTGCSSVTDFEWLSQLRFIYNKDDGDFGGICSVRQTNCNLEYGYEYLIQISVPIPTLKQFVGIQVSRKQWTFGCHATN